MTPEQALEIRRRAGLWATSRVLVSRKKNGELPMASMRNLTRRARTAEDDLLAMLDELVQAAGPHAQTPDNADAHRAWDLMAERVR